MLMLEFSQLSIKTSKLQNNDHHYSFRIWDQAMQEEKQKKDKATLSSTNVKLVVTFHSVVGSRRYSNS